MNNKIQFLGFSAIALAALLFTPAIIVAQTESTSSAPNRETRQLERQETQTQRSAERETRIAERCDRITSRIDEILGRYSERRDKYLQNAEVIEGRLSGLLGRLDEAGYDITEIREALNRLNAAKANFRAVFSEFIAGLENAKSHACGDSEGKFVNEVAKSREALKEIRLEARELVRIAREDVREALQNIRDEVSATRAARSSSTAGITSAPAAETQRGTVIDN